MISPKYFSEKDAPLKYYHFLNVLVLVWLVVSVGRLFYFISQDNMVGVVEIAILLTIQLFVASGLHKKRWSGVVALYCMYAYNIFDVLVALGIYVYYGVADASTLGETIGSIIGVLIWAIPTWVYFSKRRPLFDPYEENIDEQNSEYKRYQVCIFDETTKNLRKEELDIDVIKFPPSEFSVNDTYYVIETIKDNKKVRIYYEKNDWDKQIENTL